MTEKRRIKYFVTNTRVQLKFLYTNFLILVPIATLYFHIQDREKIINDFRANKILTCNIKNLIIDVSNETNWKIEDYYFIKSNTKIPASKCERINK